MEPIIINSIPIAINKPQDSFYNQYHTFDRSEQNTPEDDNFNHPNHSPTSFSQSAPDRIENYSLTNQDRNNQNISTIPNWNSLFPSPTITVDSIRRYDKRCSYVSPLDKFRINTVSRDNNNNNSNNNCSTIFCPICQDSKKSSECKITICNHHFCKRCITNWLIEYKHDNCPVCNKNLKV